MAREIGIRNDKSYAFIGIKTGKLYQSRMAVWNLIGVKWIAWE